MESDVISRASVAELDDIVGIERSCFDVDGFSRSELRYLVAHSRGGVYVARRGNLVVGYISLLMRSGCSNLRIYSIAVNPEFKGHGTGRALIRFAAQQAHSLGLDRLTLEVRTDNSSALALYSSEGFEVVRTLHGYYHDGADALYMTRSIK